MALLVFDIPIEIPIFKLLIIKELFERKSTIYIPIRAFSIAKHKVSNSESI
jgi:hypothetical protein